MGNKHIKITKLSHRKRYKSKHVTINADTPSDMSSRVRCASQKVFMQQDKSIMWGMLHYSEIQHNEF